ncbi:MAG: hypothetical protein WD847_17730 [Pirellulales bacterium]
MLKQAVADWLAGLGYWGSEGTIVRRMQEDYSSFDACDYSYFLSDDFDQSVIHLPNAIDFVAGMRPDSCLVVESVARFIATSAAELEHANLMAFVFQQLRMTIKRWVSAFEPTHDCDTMMASGGNVQETLHEPPVIDCFFDAILASRIACPSGDMFSVLLSEWVGDYSSGTSSASVLDFFFRVRFCPGDLKLYRDKLALGFAFNESIAARHWTAAQAVMTQKCGTPYLEVIRKGLLRT